MVSIIFSLNCVCCRSRTAWLNRDAFLFFYFFYILLFKNNVFLHRYIARWQIYTFKRKSQRHINIVELFWFFFFFSLNKLNDNYLKRKPKAAKCGWGVLTLQLWIPQQPVITGRILPSHCLFVINYSGSFLSPAVNLSSLSKCYLLCMSNDVQLLTFVSIFIQLIFSFSNTHQESILFTSYLARMFSSVSICFSLADINLLCAFILYGPSASASTTG